MSQNYFNEELFAGICRPSCPAWENSSCYFFVIENHCSADFLIIPEVPGEDISYPVPAASQTTFLLLSGLRNNCYI